MPNSDAFVTVIAARDRSRPIDPDFVVEVSEALKQHYESYELIIVDNGAPEGSFQRVVPLLRRYPAIRVIRLSRPYERDTAIFAGLDAAIGEVVIVLDPAIDSAGFIPDLVRKVRAGHDVVHGVSTTPLHRSFWSRIGHRFFHWYVRRFMDIDIPLNATHLIALNRRAVNALTRTKGRYRHVRQLSRRVGFSASAFQYRPKALEERGLLEAVNLAVEIAVSYSRHPLRAVSVLGLAAATLNFLYVGYILAVYFFKDRVAEGWTTLSLQVAGMFFLVFLTLVVLSEYVGRILEETREGPPYHVMEELESKVLVANAERRNVTAITVDENS